MAGEEQGTGTPAPNLGGFGGRRRARAFAAVVGDQAEPVEPLPSVAEEPSSPRPPDPPVARVVAPQVATVPKEAPPPAAVMDAAAVLVKPTVLSIPQDVHARFGRMRRNAASHTGIVLDALRAHHSELPQLVAARRHPAGVVDDPFPARPAVPPRGGVPLPIRPTAAELEVIDGMVSRCADVVGPPRASRSEVVAAALDAYLPQVTRSGRTSREASEEQA